MPNIFKKLSAWLLVIASPLTIAQLGDKPLDWSKLEAEDFQDFAIRSLNQQGSLRNHYWSSYWLSQKTLELNLANPKDAYAFTPLVIAEDQINAFAIPGNIIGINQGLWAFADNESEFLSVLAHEMSHISLDHFMRLANAQNEQTWLIASGILLTILLAQNNPEAANATLISSLALASQNNLTFSQAMELEADQLAQRIMKQANYDDQSGRQFFQRLEQNSLRLNASEFLQSHPSGSTRASQLSNEATPTSSEQEINGFQVLKYYLLKDSDFKEKSPFKGVDADQIAASNDPNVHLGWLKHRYAEPSQRSEYVQALSDLALRFRGFLPVKFELLTIQSNNGDANLCNHYSDFVQGSNGQYITLDVLELLKQVALTCDDKSKNRWYAQWLWQSGKEKEAIILLSETRKQSLNTNEHARLKQQLDTLNARYERFR